MDRGLTGAIKNQSTRTNVSVTREEFDEFKSRFVKARVLDIVYDENSPGWEELGQWNGVGTINFEVVDYQTRKEKSRGTARPIFPNFKHFPLKNEIVYLFKLPAEQNSYTDNEDYYYLPPVPIWNHPHHNAMPNLVDGLDDENQAQDYEQIEGGSVRRVKDGSTEVPLNNGDNGTFVEMTDIHPLIPYAGDVLMEGRFGNSIRLGNTAKSNSQYKNEYSEVGDNGSPITIIRNGQPSDANDEGWLPISESVNLDKSSIYMTTTQKIPLTPSNEDYSAFNEPPTNASEYTENQIILNSGRLYFNSRQDDIVLSSGGNVAIQGIKSVGISADESLVLNSSDIKIGNKNADQHLVLGDDFMVQFESLVQAVSNLASKLKTSSNWPGGAAVPNVPLIGVAVNTQVTAETILNNIKAGKLLSKVSKTI